MMHADLVVDLLSILWKIYAGISMSLNLLLHHDFHVSARCSALQHQL